MEYRLVGGRPETWQPWDCLAVFKVRHLLMGTFESKLWRARLVRELGPEKAARLLPGYEPGHLVIVPPGAAFEGPAADALQGAAEGFQRHQLDGRPGFPGATTGRWRGAGRPLANRSWPGTPHRPLDTPNVYYQNHIACGGFDVAGSLLSRMPRLPSLWPQRSRGLVCHTRRGGLPGPLRGALQRRRPKLLRVPRRVAAGGGAPRNHPGPRRTGAGAGT